MIEEPFGGFLGDTLELRIIEYMLRRKRSKYTLEEMREAFGLPVDRVRLALRNLEGSRAVVFNGRDTDMNFSLNRTSLVIGALRALDGDLKRTYHMQTDFETKVMA